MTTTTAPLIGIPCRHDTSARSQGALNAQHETYLTAIVQAGGIPFLIPLNLEPPAWRRLYDMAAGILLTGGGDLDPELIGQVPHPTLADVQPDRDALEVQCSRWAAAEGKPLLGICRGIQIMAVSAGGSLCQDLPALRPEATLHHYGYLNDQGPGWEELVHEVQLTPDSRLARILQTDHLWVNSLHHQAVESAPEPLIITGRSSDGVIEGLEITDHPFYCGVQWHPEMLVAKQAEAQRLFRVFVQASDEAEENG